MKDFDNSFLSDKISLIAGVDEAGRGPLAGPVVAAAVIFDENTFIAGINDSKKLNEKTRTELFPIIKKEALAFAIEVVDHITIDKINILQASLLAMKNSVTNLKVKPDLILIDGNKSFYSKIETKTIVKGDSKSFAIAAASILAKVTRDNIMIEAAKQYPDYGWEQNKGYPTKMHRETILKIGTTPLHRTTFLRKLLQELDGDKFL
ncbi:MAG: ribonuclease HII [Melioribacteraceae bacterium]|nr:ribonuclease HII [Melioribacteraceae bacterium]